MLYFAIVMPSVQLNVSRGSVEIGDNVTLSCWGFGYPRPNVSLSMPNGSVYNFTSPTEFKLNVTIGPFAEGGGVYTCLSINFASVNDTKTVNGVGYVLTIFYQLIQKLRSCGLLFSARPCYKSTKVSI